MAVMQNSIIFGGIDSADFGIYIGGEGVFNAPKRAVEMVTVPGRNGDIAIDQGHYENIEVTYSAFNYEEDLATFAQRLSDFRNALASQIGYQQLSDTFHPNEYRMALFVGGLEIDPIKYNTASTFEIKFDCKPQRWLANGATAITVTDGQTLSNPTPYNAEPLLAVEGHGTISFNGYEINLTNPYRGTTTLVAPIITSEPSVLYTNLDVAAVANRGDVFTINPITVQSRLFVWQSSFDDERYIDVTVSDTGDWPGVSSVLAVDQKSARISTVLDPISVNFTGSSGTTFTHKLTVTLKMRYNGSTITRTYVREMKLTYWINSSTTLDVTIATYTTPSEGQLMDEINEIVYDSLSLSGVTIDSTQWLLGTPTYIDCELGDAYKISGNEYVSLNDHIDLGSDLPKLAPGNNTFLLGENITGLTVTPRWWKL